MGCIVSTPPPVPTPPPLTEKEKVAARLHPLQNGATNEETLPRDVLLTRTWNSVVCGEHVKGQQHLFVDPSMTVLQVVQSMGQKHVEFAVVRRKIKGEREKEKEKDVKDPPKDGTASSSTSGSSSPHHSPTTAAPSTASTPPSPPTSTNDKYEYLGFFDWRDLDTLLVMACRRNQLEQLEQKDKERDGDEKDQKEQKESKDSMVVPPSSASSSSSSLLSNTIPLNSSPSITNTIMNTSTTAQSQSEKLENFLHFLDLKHTPIELVMNLSARNPLIHVNVASPLLGGAQLLVGSSGQESAQTADKKKKKNALVPVVNTRPELYRVAVVNKNKEFVGALTHNECLRFMLSRLPQLGDEGSKSLHELGLGQKRVMTIGWKSPVVSAVFIMHEKQLSGLAIVDEEKGQLVGSISVSDFKYLFQAPELLLTLQRPVSSFIWAIRQSPTHWHVNLNSGAPPTAKSTAYTCTPRTMLKDAIALLLEKKVRRLWVVNDNMQPIGLFGVRDVLHYLLPQQKSKVDDKKKKSATAITTK